MKLRLSTPLLMGLTLVWLCASVTLGAASVTDAIPLRQVLSELPFQIAYESYVSNNWEIFVSAPDGRKTVNLTRTPATHEHYPRVSPDGSKICFLVDASKDRQTIRSLWVMDRDGRNRQKLVDHAREPFWCPNGKRIGFLPQEYTRFDVMDFYTRGMSFYDLASGKITAHPYSTNLHHLYKPCFAPNGRWIVATVHGGMGISHGLVAVAANGPQVVNLNLSGCRAWLSPDGNQIAWGGGDYEIDVAPIDLDTDAPRVGPIRLRVQDPTNRVIQVDWSPDGRFLCFSRGPAGRGNDDRPGAFRGPFGLVGVQAPGWNLCVVSSERNGSLDLSRATASDFFMVTTNGCSNKEPAWFRPPRQ
jgi:Tol biopolymer transport system component